MKIILVVKCDDNKYWDYGDNSGAGGCKSCDGELKDASKDQFGRYCQMCQPPKQFKNDHGVCEDCGAGVSYISPS